MGEMRNTKKIVAERREGGGGETFKNLKGKGKTKKKLSKFWKKVGIYLG